MAGRTGGNRVRPAFFGLPEAHRRELLNAYRWVEFKSELIDAPPPALVLDSGFFPADTQIQFRIGLRTVRESPSSADLEIRFANQHPFTLLDEELAPFEHERYALLPWCTQAQITARYGLWARLLIDQHPESCLQVLAGGLVQGWFLAAPSGRGLNLTLAMLRRGGAVSGHLLYEKALAAYGAQGHRIGWASFSVTNTPVHNIYARLGAHFTRPLGVWLWIRTAHSR